MVYISHFLLAFAVSYVGSIPPGMLNLTAIEITRTEKLIGAWLFALACGFIEFFQVISEIVETHLIAHKRRNNRGEYPRQFFFIALHTILRFF